MVLPEERLHARSRWEALPNNPRGQMCGLDQATARIDLSGWSKAKTPIAVYPTGRSSPVMIRFTAVANLSRIIDRTVRVSEFGLIDGLAIFAICQTAVSRRIDREADRPHRTVAQGHVEHP